MSMPTGDSPQTVDQYYDYLQAHHQTDHEVATWHVDWVDLAWLWGFLIVLALGILFWVLQYRTTRQRNGIYPLDTFGAARQRPAELVARPGVAGAPSGIPVAFGQRSGSGSSSQCSSSVSNASGASSCGKWPTPSMSRHR